MSNQFLAPAYKKNLHILSPKKSKSSMQAHSPHRPSPQPAKQPQFNRDKMIQTHKKLRKQVLQLVQQMQQLKGKNKKKYGLGLQDMYDKKTNQKREEVMKQQQRIHQLKAEVDRLNKENQFTYDNSTATSKQNDIKALEIQVSRLQSQRAGALKVQSVQEKALADIRNNDVFFQRDQKSRQQLVKIKQQCKILLLKIGQNQKLLLKSHQKTVRKAKKIKDIQQKIRQNKQKLKKGIASNIVTVDMISQLQQQIMKLQSQHKDSQKVWQQKISNLDVEYSNRKVEQQKKLLILKEKQKEVKLNDIRLREYKKLIVQARSQKKVEGEGNMREFRNKRNIRFMDKVEN